MPEEDAMRELADKFGVEVMFAKTTDGNNVAVVTFENGEQMAYIDEEEMYQDLAKRHELSEGIENITPENVQIAADAIRQVVANLAPAAILPALMLIYKEYKGKKKGE